MERCSVLPGRMPVSSVNNSVIYGGVDGLPPITGPLITGYFHGGGPADLAVVRTIGLRSKERSRS